MSWIFGSFQKDFRFLGWPLILGLPLAFALPVDGTTYFLYLFLVSGIFEYGHVYATVWRTWLRKEERQSTSIYWTIPLATFAVFLTWILLELPYLWEFVLTATVYHNIRQLYGVNKWYQKLNGRMCKHADTVIYFVTSIPALLFIASPQIHTLKAFSDLSISGEFYPYILALYFLGLGLWMAYEAFHFIKGRREYNRIFLGVSAGIAYAAGFLYGKNYFQMMAPLVLIHAPIYFGLVGLSLERLKDKRFVTNAFWKLLLTGAVLGVPGFFLQQEVNSLDSLTAHPVLGTLVALRLMFLFSHFLFDAHIWQGKHREAKWVYAADKYEKKLAPDKPKAA